MNQTQTGKQSAAAVHEAGSSGREGQDFVLGLCGVRYQVKDVSRSIDFYTQRLGFRLDQKNLPAFGQVSIGNFKLIKGQTEPNRQPVSRRASIAPG